MALVEAVKQFVAEHLPQDLTTWTKQYSRPKIVHDALWGTFEVRAHEIALLDTPLLQRLRFIRQTGAVYATYPSALHTRFEHTLGVLHNASRLCSALRARSNEGRMDQQVQDNVRLAAILHDTGHGPFSHTSEQFFSSLDDVAAAKAADPLLHGSGAGEILSSAIITSDAMKQFVRHLNETYKLRLDCELISRLVTGTVKDDEMFLSEIVHGPFDADKLDYMPRDGMFSGLKMHVDLDRLFNSIDIIASEVDGQRMTRLVGSVAGISPLMQLMFNKMLLFTGIYHHHKVRTVDCMLWAIFQLAVERKATIGGVRVENATDFLKLTDDRVLIPELADDPEIKGLIVAIRNRRLWKRALIISRRTVPESMHNQAKASPAKLFPGFAMLAGNSQQKIHRRRKLSDRIWEVAGKPCPQYHVWLDIPARPSMDEARQMWIRGPGNDSPQTLGQFIPIGEWVELYGMHQWRAHVFAPAEFVRKIGEAAETVLREEFGLELLPTARAYAHNV
jgi:uncharacterized protein